MLKTLWTGKAGLYANQQRMDIISNNIANIGTNGYKSSDVTFLDTVYEASDRLGLPISTKNKENLVTGSGAKAEAIIRDGSPGNMQKTGNLNDLAIDGNGYFRLKDNKGNYYYTRDGAFKIDANGNFVHSSGLLLDVQNYNSKGLKADNYEINENGNIISDNKIIGKINLYDFIDTDNLKSVGNNMFIADGKATTSSAKIKQQYLEGSNVDFGTQIVDMMMTQRAFDLNSKSIKAADEMWQITNNLRSK